MKVFLKGYTRNNLGDDLFYKIVLDRYNSNIKFYTMYNNKNKTLKLWIESPILISLNLFELCIKVYPCSWAVLTNSTSSGETPEYSPIFVHTHSCAIDIAVQNSFIIFISLSSFLFFIYWVLLVPFDKFLFGSFLQPKKYISH